MWNVYATKNANAADLKFGYLHSCATKKAAQEFARRWASANPGRFTRIVSTKSGALGTPGDRPGWLA